MFKNPGYGNWNWLNEATSDLFGSGGKGSDAGLMKLGGNLFELADSTLGSEGFLAYPKKTWDMWADKLQGGGGGDGEDDEISSSRLDTPTVDDTVNLDPGVDQTTAPMFTDVSMSASRSTARSALGGRGYDTGTSKGRTINERRNKRMGTALTRSMA